MSKLHFQPLLFDSFKYKPPNTTYQEHYKKKFKKQSTILNRRYNISYQKKHPKSQNFTIHNLKNNNKQLHSQKNELINVEGFDRIKKLHVISGFQVK
jgi:hypothetical protein